MADEKLLHSEDVIFNKPSLKEFVRLIKNGTINAIWPSTPSERDWWNNVGVNQYKDQGAKPLNNLNTALTVFYGDNEDVSSTDNLNKEQSKNNFNNLKTSIQEIQDIITKEKKYILQDETLGYPELIYDENTGEIINKNNYINHKDNVINNYIANIATIDRLIEKLTTYKPERDPNKVISKLSNPNFEDEYNNLYIQTENLTSGSILDTINSNFKNKLNIVPNDLDDIVNLLMNEEVIGDRNSDVFNISKIRDIIEPYRHNVIDIVAPILKQCYPNDCDLPGDIYETIGFSTQHDNLLNGYIGKYETIAKNFKENLTRLFSNFQSDNMHNIDAGCIGGITLDRSILVLPTDEEELDQLKKYNNFYNRYITPYHQIIKDIGYLTGVGQYLSEDIEPKVLTESEYVAMILKNVENDIKQAVTLDDKLQVVKDFVEMYEMAYIRELYSSKLGFFTKGTEIIDGKQIDPELNNIVFLMNGEIKNKDKILETMHIIINIIAKEKEIVERYSLTNLQINYNYDEIWQENEIGYVFSNFKSIKEDYENIYRSIMIYFEYYNTLINNLKEKMRVKINNKVNQFILSNTTFVNRDDVRNSIIEYKEILNNHYNILIGLNNTDISIQDNKTTALQIIDNLLSDLAIIDVFVSDGAKEDDFNALIALFNNSNIPKILYILTGDQIPYSADNFTLQASTDYYSIKNAKQVEENLNQILNINMNESREYYLNEYLTQISNLVLGFTPVYTVEPFYHYTCFSSGSEVLFPSGTLSNKNNAVSTANQDGTVPIIVDNIIYYPQLKGLTNSPTSARNTEIPTIAGLKNILGDTFNKLGTTSKGNTYLPIYFDQGSPVEATNVVHGQFQTGSGEKSNYWNIVYRNGDSVGAASLAATKIFGAVYNDYAEYRAAEAEPGRCIIENGDGTLSLSTGRLQLGANIVSDTYGFAIGETNDATCPIAVCGRVLAHPLESKEVYHPGAAVCSGPEGTVSLMTREEIREWPDAIVGYVSEVPTYDTWGTDNVPVNGRIWIKIK